MCIPCSTLALTMERWCHMSCHPYCRLYHHTGWMATCLACVVCHNTEYWYVTQVHQLEELGLTRGLIEGGIVSGLRKRQADISKKYPNAIYTTNQDDRGEIEILAGKAMPTWRTYGPPVAPADSGASGSSLPTPPAGSLGSFKDGIQSIPKQVGGLRRAPRLLVFFQLTSILCRGYVCGRYRSCLAKRKSRLVTSL